MRILFVVFATCALLVRALPAYGAPGPASGSPLARETQRLVDAFRAAIAGDDVAREQFLQRHLASTQRTSLESASDILERLQKTGGAKLESISERPPGLRLIVSAANGRTSRIDLAASAEAGRISALLPVPIPAPYSGPRVVGGLSHAELAAAIDRRVRFAADRDEFSGTILVKAGDAVVYSASFGAANKARSVLNTADTRFNIGSMDKQFTAVAIGQLVDEGLLTFDTQLVDVLPEYPNRAVAEKITVRHLLSHRAGLGMLFERPGWDWKRRFERMADLLPLFAAGAPKFEPGSRFSYSNEGFVVLGAIVERLSGLSWHEYAKARIFAPAGMQGTEYLTDDSSAAHRAIGYRFADTDPLGLGPRVPNSATLSWRGGSHGGGFSTARDMVRFLQKLQAGKLLRPQTVAALFDDGEDQADRYALGFEREEARPGRTFIGHDGGGPASGINSDAKMILETGYTYAVLGNYDAPFAQALGRDIGDILAAQ